MSERGGPWAVVASALCGAALEPWQLIAARAAQGVGAALITPQTLTIMTAVFPPERRGLPSAVWGVTAGLAGLAGPALGGFLVAEGGWRWIFHVNVPIGIVTVIMAFVLIPGTRPGGRPRLDVPGALLAATALGAITYGLLEGDRYGWGAITSFLGVPMVIGAGLVLLAVFLATQARTRQPLLPLGVFRDRGFSLMSFVVVAVSFGMMGLSLTLTIYLQRVLGLGALQAGLTLAPTALAMMVSFPVVGFLIDRFGGKYVLIGGLTLYPVSLVLIAVTARADSGRWALLGPLVLAGIGQAAAFASTVTMAVRDVREEFTGAASGAFNAIRQPGFLVAVAATGAVLQNRLSTGLGDEARRRAERFPGRHRGDFVDAVTAAAGGAQAGAGQVRLPAGVDGALARRMRESAQSAFDHAFTGALRWTLLVCAAVVVLAGLLSLTAGRPGPAGLPAPRRNRHSGAVRREPRNTSLIRQPQKECVGMDLGLAGKVVLITGGSGSIGGHLAVAFAAEGARVAITYHRNEDGAHQVAREVIEQGDEAVIVRYDLTDPASIRAAFDTVAATWGGVDVLVVNASAIPGTKVEPVAFEDIPVEEWRSSLRADVEGSFHTVQAALPGMKERGWGRIVFVSANIVQRGGDGDEAFVASKMAMHGLSRTLATELAPEGILVNVVAPGPTVTKGFLARVSEEFGQDLAGKSPEQIKRFLNRGKPVGHISTPQDVAGIVLYLASATNGNVTGGVVHVAGGH